MNIKTDTDVHIISKKTNKPPSPFEEIDPWPGPINPSELLTEISLVIRRFIVCDPEVYYAAALWVAMTWFIDEVQVAPLAVITAPEKRCGKSHLLTLLGKLSARPIVASNISTAALYRTIDEWKPTLLIDEADAFMKENEELRGVLNSGHTRDTAYVIRTVGKDHTPTRFSTWGAKAIAGIGHLADTLMDRAIVLELRRKLPHEEVDRLRHAEQGLFQMLQSKLARFVADFRESVRMARPPLPQRLNDRAQDNWEPLLAIAMTAGADWLQIGTTAALKLSEIENQTITLGTELLGDIRELFEHIDDDRIFSNDLIRELQVDEEKPWATYNRGFPIKPKQVARILRSYGIFSKTIRKSYKTAKGYERDQFQEAFSRYVCPPSTNVTASQIAAVTGLPESSHGNINETAIDYTLHVTTDEERRKFPQDTSRYPSVAVATQSEGSSLADCDEVTDKLPPWEIDLRCDNLLYDD